MNKKPDITKIKNYLCCYGKPGLASLLNFDLLILEPSYYSDKTIEFLKRKSIVTAYCSIGEAEAKEVAHIDKKNCLIYDNQTQKPVQNKDWGSFYADPQKQGWINHVLKKADSLLNKKGFQGLFLDTIDTVDIFPEKSDAMAELVMLLYSRYPDSIFIANRGLSIFSKISSSVDGLMFECFSGRYDFTKKKVVLFSHEDMKWIHSIYQSLLRPYIKNRGLVLALDYADGPDDQMIDIAYSRARDYGLIPLVTSVDLLKSRPYQGKIIKKYIKEFGKSRFENSGDD
jgi:hypothetical protein